MTRDQALKFLRTWARWNDPGDDWIRQQLKKLGKCGPHDVVTSNWLTLQPAQIPEHERNYVQLFQRLCTIAGVQHYLVRRISYCGGGSIEKRLGRVIVNITSELAEDDFFVRLDVENRGARKLLEAQPLSRPEVVKLHKTGRT